MYSRDAVYKWRAKNAEKYKAYQRSYFKSEKGREIKRRWAMANKDKINARRKVLRELNKDKINARRKELRALKKQEKNDKR